MSDAVDQAAVSEAINRLGLSLLKSLSQESEDNVFISPFSLSTALAMLHCGARGDTRREMRQVFGYEQSRLSDDNVSSAFSSLLSSLDKSSDSYELSCANSLVMQRNFSVKDEYKQLLKESFQASLFEADLEKESEKAVKDINQWVEGKTKGMIPQLLTSLDPTTVMVLLNAIYFKGTWIDQFNERCTNLQNFYNGGLEKNAKRVPMMNQANSFPCIERDSFSVLQLPYRGRNVAMMVFLPRSLDGIEELQKQLTPELLKELKKELPESMMWVNVSLPKFECKYSKSMKEVFQKLGIRKVFEMGADLGGISGSKELNLLDVVHKAVVEVDELGTRAVAVTCLRGGGACDTTDFLVNRPFLFAIYDEKNDVILFLGRIDKL